MSEHLERRERAPRDGVAHLRVLAQTPRAAGSAEEDAAREHCTAALRTLGFDVAREPFEYSRFPGRFGTPIGGAIAMITVVATVALTTLMDAPRAGAMALVGGLVLLALHAWRMLGDGVLDHSLRRARGTNLVGRRGGEAPRVWLVAHLDSKSQPVPSRVRVTGIVLLAASIPLTLVAQVVTLTALAPRIVLWALAAGLAIVGGVIVMASVVRNESPGAVDDASGVAAVLAAAALLDPRARVGVLLTSAEELGLAGARWWVRAHRAEDAVVLNCDGVDDHGELTIMYTGRKPERVIEAVRAASASAPRVRRMPPGLLLDSVAFSDAGWAAVTVSHGSMRTLGRVHTRADSLDHLRGDRIDEVAVVLARAAEALAR